jgi:hypothetical protein
VPRLADEVQGEDTPVNIGEGVQGEDTPSNHAHEAQSGHSISASSGKSYIRLGATIHFDAFRSCNDVHTLSILAIFIAISTLSGSMLLSVVSPTMFV